VRYRLFSGEKLAVADLVDPLGRGQVLQPVLAQIAQPVRVDERRGRGRDEHLPAMACGADPRRPVHVDADIPLLVQMRGARVDADAHPDRPGGQPLEHAGRSPECARCGRKGDEEGVPLRVDLDAAVGVEGLAQDAAMLRQRRRIPLGTQLVEQLRRPLDVGEEEGDGSGRKVALHSIIMNQRGGELTLRHTRGSNSPPHGPLCRSRRGS